MPARQSLKQIQPTRLVFFYLCHFPHAMKISLSGTCAPHNYHPFILCFFLTLCKVSSSNTRSLWLITEPQNQVRDNLCSANEPLTTTRLQSTKRVDFFWILNLSPQLQEVKHQCANSVSVFFFSCQVSSQLKLDGNLLLMCLKDSPHLLPAD